MKNITKHGAIIKKYTMDSIHPTIDSLMDYKDIAKKILDNQEALVRSYQATAEELTELGFMHCDTVAGELLSACSRCCLSDICSGHIWTDKKTKLDRYQCGPWSGTADNLEALNELTNIKKAHM